MINRNISVQTFFDGLAVGWAERYRNDPAIAARLARFTEALTDRVAQRTAVLDFGCGAGVITRWLARQDYVMSGCDLSPDMVQEAQSATADGAIRFDTCDGGLLPYDDGAFAAVVSSSVLEYVVDLNVTLTELHRVLVPGGWLLLTVPDSRHRLRRKESLYRAILRLPLVGTLVARSRWAEGAAYSLLSRNRMSPQGWVHQLQGCGFYAEQVSACEGPLLLLAARRREAPS